MTGKTLKPGLRVLLLEDEALVSMLMESMLEDLNCELAGIAMRVDEALRIIAARSGEMDAAILDVNLAGETAFPAAEALKAAGVPFGFATGYGPGGLPPEWRDAPVLNKPYTQADVEALLIQLDPRG